MPHAARMPSGAAVAAAANQIQPKINLRFISTLPKSESWAEPQQYGQGLPRPQGKIGKVNRRATRLFDEIGGLGFSHRKSGRHSYVRGSLPRIVLQPEHVPARTRLGRL